MEKNKKSINLIKIETNYHENPTLIFQKICKNKVNTLLLESAEISNKKKLESMIITDTAIRITCFKQEIILESKTKNGLNILKNIESNIPSNIKIIKKEKVLTLIFPKIKKQISEEQKLKNISIFESFRLIIKSIKKNEKYKNEMFFGGLFSYDLVTNFEPIPRMKKNKKFPDFCFYLAEILLVLDHQKKTCIIQASIFTEDKIENQRINNKINKIKNILKSELPKIKNDLIQKINITSNKTENEYIQQIKKIKKLITLGEIFQIVLSRKFYLNCINSIASYDKLKQKNPSPYMFFMQDQIFTLFGASPESSLKYNSKNRIIEIHPIAGTRPRGKNQDGSLNLDLDNKIELEMRTDQKELAEHLMLVDLARNDLSKICQPGTRYVENLMKVDKYSHVMHLVSKVIGKLNSKLDIFHAYQACMNMGTLTGSPKIRAMQIIAESELQPRNAYGGAIGYFNGNGDLDTCIVIRSATVINQIATIQAGAGIILDSIPYNEVLESTNKAQAVLSAIIDAHEKKD